MKDIIFAVLKWIAAIFCDENGQPSSKRIIAFIGLCTVISCYVYCTRHNQQMLDITEYLTGAFVVLLGIDPMKSVLTSKKTEE